MRMLSYNVRGLGSVAKCRDVGDIIRKKRVDFCMLQESKKEEVDEFLCKSIWTEGNFSWAYRGSEGVPGIWKVRL